LLETYQTDDALTHVQQELNDRQPLGTMCEARWVRYKRVRVKARVVAYREERPETIRARVLERLYQSINPLPAGPEEPGWNFGQELHASHVYDISLTAPGVNRVEQVSLIVDEAPSEAVGAIAADRFQPGTWYAGSHHTLFRSVNNGAGWEAVGRFPEGKIEVIRVSTEQAGLVAAVTTESVDRVTFRSQLHLSWDSGESWETPLPFGFRIRDVAWLLGASSPTLLLATDVGLFEVVMRDMERNPLQVLVAPEDPSLGFYAVASARDAAGQIHLVVAAQKARGIYLCIEGAGARTFEHSGLAREDVRVLMVEYQGPRAILWAGLYSAGADEGTGCYRRELRSLESVQDTWHAYSTNWEGGSCRSLALLGSTVVAGTHRAGLRWLAGDRWQPEQLNLESGLPLRGREYLFYPIDALAADTRGQFLLSGGPRGVFRSLDAGETYENCSRHEYTDKVALPQTYLFCSGEHEIEVVSEDEAY
jgi:hypothetical protein